MLALILTLLANTSVHLCIYHVSCITTANICSLIVHTKTNLGYWHTSLMSLSLRKEEAILYVAGKLYLFHNSVFLWEVVQKIHIHWHNFTNFMNVGLFFLCLTSLSNHLGYGGCHQPSQLHPHNVSIHDPNKPHTDWID